MLFQRSDTVSIFPELTSQSINLSYFSLVGLYQWFKIPKKSVEIAPRLGCRLPGVLAFGKLPEPKSLRKSQSRKPSPKMGNNFLLPAPKHPIPIDFDSILQAFQRVGYIGELKQRWLEIKRLLSGGLLDATQTNGEKGPGFNFCLSRI